MSAPDGSSGVTGDSGAEDAPADPVPAQHTARGESAGDVIDRYTLVEEIGEGGMGTVWLAEQREPVARKVALKIIKLGMDTREVVVRFEAERQALALMDHPHIAKVHDGGATAGGRPYFVMELVEGAPITTYCDEHELGLRERLELFARVCKAIQHAHGKGIIHRDIKPSNVLVALHDGQSKPKVIDFGVAKATSAELTQKTLFTQHGQIIGTPEYMAPEQARMGGLDIDTRADVYALGSLLYEMLTGTKLFEMRDVLEVGYQELLRVIQEVEPPKPSTRVSTLGEAVAAIAANRHVDADSLSKRLAGDLDWIVMKALEKDRTRRYETANGLAADVQRFLEQQPVVAAPPSATYRLRKFVRRRRKTVAAIGVIVFLLIAGSVGTGIDWWNTQQANAALGLALHKEERQRTLAQQNEARAKRAEGDARTEADRARRAEGEAEARAAELQQVADFQSSQLSELDPGLMGMRLRQSLIDAAPDGRRERVTESLEGLNFTNIALQALEENLFERTIEAIGAQFADQPLVEAQLLAAVAETLYLLGLLDIAGEPTQRALSIRRREFGDEHPDTHASVSTMGQLLEAQGRYGEAEPYLREALDGRRRFFGDEHQQTLVAIHNLSTLLKKQERIDESELYLREALDGFRRVLGDDHPLTLHAIESVMSDLGAALLARGELVEAGMLLEESAAWMLEDPTDPAVGATLQRLVALYDARHAAGADQGFDSIAEEWRERLEAWKAEHEEDSE